jgi:hypothetical protein
MYDDQPVSPLPQSLGRPGAERKEFSGARLGSPRLAHSRVSFLFPHANSSEKQHFFSF